MKLDTGLREKLLLPIRASWWLGDGTREEPLTLTLSIDPLHFEEQQVPRARGCDEAQEERRETRKPMRYTCIGLRLIQLI